MKIFIAILVFTVVSFTARAQSPKPYFKEAKALLKENKKEEALAKINTAIELAPKNKEYLLFRADINEKLYRYRAAVKDLDDYLLIVKDDDKIMMKAGLLSLAIPDYNLADKHYGSVLELDSKNILALQNKSFSLIHLGAYQAAINALNFSMEVDKKSNYSYFLKGVAYDSLKDYTNAFTNYKKAIELAEDKEGKNLVTKNFYQEYYFNKGRANYKLKIYEEALKDFTKAATIDKEDTHVPKNTQLNYYVGLTQFAKSDFVEAINSFGKSIAANENFHAAFISRGYVYLKMGQYAISLDDFTHVILKNDTITQALIGRAECYASTGKFTEAISDLGKALKNQKGNEVLLKKIEELKAKM